MLSCCDRRPAPQDADWALLLGAKPRGPGMERSDLLDMNGKIFERQGKALNKVAKRSVKVSQPPLPDAGRPLLSPACAWPARSFAAPALQSRKAGPRSASRSSWWATPATRTP